MNVLTLGVQLFLTGRIVGRLGVGATLAILPGLQHPGFAALAWTPTIAVIVAFQVLRRAGNFAIARPIREVLFTVVPREDRYKAKSFIDTVVYRLGDQAGAWSFTGIGALGLGAAGSPEWRCRCRSCGSSTACGSGGPRTAAGGDCGASEHVAQRQLLPPLRGEERCHFSAKLVLI